MLIDIIFFREIENLWESACSLGPSCQGTTLSDSSGISFLLSYFTISKLRALRSASTGHSWTVSQLSLQFSLIYHKNTPHSPAGALCPRSRYPCFMGEKPLMWLGPHNPSTLHPERRQLPLWPWLFIESMRFVFVVHSNEFLAAGGWEGDLQHHFDTANSLMPQKEPQSIFWEKSGRKSR